MSLGNDQTSTFQPMTFCVNFFANVAHFCTIGLGTPLHAKTFPKRCVWVCASNRRSSWFHAAIQFQKLLVAGINKPPLEPKRN